MRASRHATDEHVPSRWVRALRDYPARDLPAIAIRQLREVLRRRRGPVGTTVLDLTGRVDDPIEAVYLSETSTPLLEVPLERLRWSDLGLPLDEASNPFVRTAAQHLSGEVTDYESSALRHHYERWCPSDVGAALGLDSTGRAALQQPPELAVLPWKALAGGSRAGSPGPTSDLHLGDKWHGAKKFYGPVTDDFGRTEFGRYQRVADSIASHGFLVGLGGYIRVSILAADHDWVANMYAGAHRLAAVAALQLDPVTVAIHGRPKLVRREDAPSWPGVRSGLFTEEQAVGVFDRIFAGDPPAAYRPATRGH
jgi:hypothetical protein